MDFGYLGWDIVLATFSYVLWFEVSKSMFGLQARILTILEWKIYSCLMSQPFKNIVNTDVFIRFLIFDIFLNLMSLASLRGLILDTLGGIWLPKSDILGSWKGIGIFITFQGISSLSLGGRVPRHKFCVRVTFP